MVHPAVYAAIVVGGVVVVGLKLYEEYKEAKMYEQYQRHRHRFEQEQHQYSHFQHKNNEFDDNSDDEDTLRRRKPFSRSNQSSYPSVVDDQYELSDLETSVAERKRRLMAEQAFLDQEEENLRNRKDALKRSFDDVTKATPLAFLYDNDNQSSHNDMGQFSESQEIIDSTETIINERPLHNSTELYYPAASLTHATSTTNSVISSHLNRVSDSEESWNDVSENEWNNYSSANESDNEYGSHHSIASVSDENRIRF